MKTKDDYLERAKAVIAEYPKAALAYQVRDPRLMALLESMATMLALHSMEQDTAAMEPWTKARDVTVLADAAAKGVLPFGTPMQVALSVQNATDNPFTILTGRRLMDQQGRLYVVTVGATVPASGAAVVTAIQQTSSTLTHAVTANEPFYRIEVPAPEIGHIAEVRVADALGNSFTYTPEFTNVEVEQRVFHLESDENRTLAVVFGADAIGGYQPGVGDVLTVTTLVTEGDVSLSEGAQFVFEHAATPAEAGAKIVLTEVTAPGAAPMDIATLREITSYPSLYDGSAVYNGNFDFLLRRNLSPFRFLAVWNEQREEAVRGASVDHMNRLFVAAVKDGVSDATLQADVTRVIMAADDSYRLKWVAVEEVAVPVSVTLRVPDVYDSAAVEQQAREIVLAEYGRDSAWAKRGSGRVLYKRVTKLLTDGIQACQAEDADVLVTVNDSETILPETYRYVSVESLTIVVENLQ